MEKSLLGTILLNDSLIAYMLQIPNIFIEEKNIKILEIAKDLFKGGIIISSDAIIAKDNKINITYLNELYDNAFQEDLFEIKLNEQIKKYMNNKLNIIQNKFKSNYYKTYQDYLQDIKECDIEFQLAKNETKTLKEVYGKYLLKNQKDRYYTGFNYIDKMGGIKKSSLIIIGARPSVGKTSLMVQMLKNDMRYNYKCGVFSLEMDDVDIIQKLLSNVTDIDENKIDLKILNDDQEMKISKYMDATKDYPIFINDNPDIDIDVLYKTILQWDKEYNLDKYYIDYLQYIPCYKNFSGSTERVEYIIKKLARLKKKIGKNIIILAQLNRELEQSGNRRKPRLSDLKNSGQIEQDGDIIWLLHEELQYDSKISEIEIIMAKGRKMPKGVIDCIFSKNLSKIEEKTQHSS
jgi:replicative DNA helicase